MAILVNVKMVNRINDLVTYSFTNEHGSEGKFDVNKKTGELFLTSPMPSDRGKTYFTRAAVKVVNDWKSRGELPEKTYWSS